ncbi:hypothetical protein ACTMU2_23345 [Cupriavidus basilensis]
MAEGLVLELGKLIDWTSSQRGPLRADGTGRAPSRFTRSAARAGCAIWRRGRARASMASAFRLMLATPWLDDVLAGARRRSRCALPPAAGAAAPLRATDTSRCPRTWPAELRPCQHVMPAGYRRAMTLAAGRPSAPAWPTTWAWARRRRHWRCCWRADGGAGLVVAPTSVCGNWAAEVRRHCAPTLKSRFVHAEGDRETRACPGGPGRSARSLPRTLLRGRRARPLRARVSTVVADGEAQAHRESPHRAARRRCSICPLASAWRFPGTPVEKPGRPSSGR